MGTFVALFHHKLQLVTSIFLGSLMTPFMLCGYICLKPRTRLSLVLKSFKALVETE